MEEKIQNFREYHTNKGKYLRIYLHFDDKKTIYFFLFYFIGMFHYIGTVMLHAII